MGMNTNELTAVITEATDKVLDEWTAEAKAQGIDATDYYEAQVEMLDAETAKVISARYLQRVLAA
jgi:hypothetical protein